METSKMYQTSSFDSKFLENNLQCYSAVKLTLRANLFCIFVKVIRWIENRIATVSYNRPHNCIVPKTEFYLYSIHYIFACVFNIL